MSKHPPQLRDITVSADEILQEREGGDRRNVRTPPLAIPAWPTLYIILA